MRIQMRQGAVEVIGGQRATGAPLRLVLDPQSEPEHEVVDEQLRASVEELGQGLRSGLGFEAVVLLDRHPGQFPAPTSDLIALAHVLLLALEQFLARLKPLLFRSDRVPGHRTAP